MKLTFQLSFDIHLFEGLPLPYFICPSLQNQPNGHVTHSPCSGNYILLWHSNLLPHKYEVGLMTLELSKLPQNLILPVGLGTPGQWMNLWVGSIINNIPLSLLFLFTFAFIHFNAFNTGSYYIGGGRQGRSLPEKYRNPELGHLLGNNTESTVYSMAVRQSL